MSHHGILWCPIFRQILIETVLSAPLCRISRASLVQIEKATGQSQHATSTIVFPFPVVGWAFELYITPFDADLNQRLPQFLDHIATGLDLRQASAPKDSPCSRLSREFYLIARHWIIEISLELLESQVWRNVIAVRKRFPEYMDKAGKGSLRHLRNPVDQSIRNQSIVSPRKGKTQNFGKEFETCSPPKRRESDLQQKCSHTRKNWGRQSMAKTARHKSTDWPVSSWSSVFEHGSFGDWAGSIGDNYRETWKGQCSCWWLLTAELSSHFQHQSHWPRMETKWSA